MVVKSSDINEATFEARVHSEIKRLFPAAKGFKLTHQRYIQFQIGHKKIPFDSYKYHQFSGRLDVLVSMDDNNLAILELKSPKVILTPEDKEQGLSYARAICPSPPLVIVSNGEDTLFYQTSDGKIWETKSVNEDSLQKIFSYSLKFATEERERAISLLFENNSLFRKELFNEYSQNEIKELQGEVQDFELPLAEDFSIDRLAVVQTLDLISKEESLIVISGPAISGKTNIVAQLCKSEKSKFLTKIFISAKEASYGVFQHIADQLAKEFRIRITNSDVKQWLWQERSNHERIAIIIDDWDPTLENYLKNDIQELLHFVDNFNSITLILTLDENIYNKLKKNPGRKSSSLIGRKAKIIQVQPLNDEEFEYTRKHFYEKYKSIFQDGSELNQDFRIPRILRILATSCKRSYSLKGKGKIEENVFIIPSITNFFIFDVWEKYLDDPKIFTQFRIISNTFIAEKAKRSQKQNLAILAHGRGHITWEAAIKEIGAKNLEELEVFGLVGIVKGPNNHSLMIPKIPELFATTGADVIAENCIEAYSKLGPVQAYRIIIDCSEEFPYGDLVGAFAIGKIAEKDKNLTHYLIDRLLNDKPVVATLTKEGRGLVYFEDCGIINFPIGIDPSSVFINNSHPWLILSQLLPNFLKLNRELIDMFLRLVVGIGSFDNVLLRAAPTSFSSMPKFHIHDMSQNRGFICPKSGIVEPITLAMQTGFYHIPDKMIDLCKFARDEEQIFLAQRLNIAAIATQTCCDEKVENCSIRAQKILKPVLNKLMEEFKEQLKENEEETREVERNEKCPCGSGKKFKKCCKK